MEYVIKLYKKSYYLAQKLQIFASLKTTDLHLFSDHQKSYRFRLNNEKSVSFLIAASYKNSMRENPPEQKKP